MVSDVCELVMGGRFLCVPFCQVLHRKHIMPCSPVISRCFFDMRKNASCISESNSPLLTLVSLCSSTLFPIADSVVVPLDQTHSLRPSRILALRSCRRTRCHRGGAGSVQPLRIRAWDLFLLGKCQRSLGSKTSGPGGCSARLGTCHQGCGWHHRMPRRKNCRGASITPGSL